jgi:hypothetical protein
MNARGGQDMPTALIEKLTSTTAFAILFGISVLPTGGLLLLGLVFTPMVVASGELQPSAGFLALTTGGVLGFLGLVRSRWRGGPATKGAIERTIVCLVAGIAAALVVAGAAVIGALAEPRWIRPMLGLGSTIAIPHVVLILAAVGAIERMKRLYAAANGEPFDGLPVTFLLIAIGLVLGVGLVASAAA